MKSLTSQSLLKGLYQYGLNPTEWQLKASGFMSTLLLVNKQDPEFKLIGKISKKGWQQIQLLSL